MLNVYNDTVDLTWGCDPLNWYASLKQMFSHSASDTGKSSVASRPLFILGTGRSGTHFLAETLSLHQDIAVSIEEYPIFGLVTDIALDLANRHTKQKELVALYRQAIRQCSRPFYCDKSHPNIWIAEELAEEFPDALFIGIERGVYSCVASMIKHSGVSAWHTLWEKWPVPNPFLGIDDVNQASYETLPLAAKCTLRWHAHHLRMIAVSQALSNRFHFIQYEDLVEQPDQVLVSLTSFLGLKDQLRTPAIRKESLVKWKQDLSHYDVQAIDAILQEVHSPA